jgi:hypothetical protein
MGEIEIGWVAEGEEVGYPDDGGRGDDDDQRHARDRGEGTGVDGVDAQGEQSALRLRNHEEIPHEQEGCSNEGWHGPLDGPLHEAGLESGLDIIGLFFSNLICADTFKRRNKRRAVMGST